MMEVQAVYPPETSAKPRSPPRSVPQVSPVDTSRVCGESQVFSQLGDQLFLIRNNGNDRLWKVHQGEMNQEFIDELSVLHNLRHPRLTPIEEVRKSDNVHVIVYRTNSGNLKDLIHREGILPESRVAHYFRQVVEVVQYCHENNVGLGNNIRLTNFVFDGDDRENIRMDLIQSPFDTAETSMTSSRLYSPAYCSPEAVPWVGLAPYDILKADIWSLGILLYALLTGTYPYMDDNPDKQFMRIALQALPLPKNVSSSVQSLLSLLLKKDGDDRIALEDILHHPWMRQNNFSESDLYEPLFS